VRPEVIARATPGFSGADLANLVNEAALFAARGNKRLVDHIDFEKARDKIMMGAERRSMVMTEAEKEMTAYHEAGHTIVGFLSEGHDPLHKVTIIPRGRALGVTFFLPDGDRHSHTKEWFLSKIKSAFGGRLAEELIYGPEQVTDGASQDIRQATNLARVMVTRLGFSERLGPLAYAEDEEEVFLGRSITQHKNVSDDTAKIIDEEIKVIIERCYAVAKTVLVDNLDKLHKMAAALVKYETLDSEQISRIMNGREPGEPSSWSDSGKPPPSSVRPATGGSGGILQPVTPKPASPI
jgi:cell division protease FtsH